MGPRRRKSGYRRAAFPARGGQGRAAACDPVACGPAWAAIAGPPPAAMPAISVIRPTAMAILVVQRIRIRVPSLQRTVCPWSGFPLEALTQRDTSQEPDESRAGAPIRRPRLVARPHRVADFLQGGR